MSNTTASGDRTPGQLEAATVQPAAQTVEVAKGAVVSRTLMRTAGGTVTAFAFDAGQALSEHTAPFDALVHLLEGELVVAIAGREHPLTAGDLVLMPRDVPHAVHAPHSAIWLLTMLRAPQEEE